MSTITSKWDEDMIRYILHNLDIKTGLKGADFPIFLADHAGSLGSFEYKSEMKFWFKPAFIDDPLTNEAAVVDLIRHEYAHFYVQAANLEKYIGHSRRETSHGKDWKWACKMVRAIPKRCYDRSDFKDVHWTVEDAAVAYNADDVVAFDILGFINKWRQTPVDSQIAEKMILQIKTQYPHAYYEPGDKVFHAIRGHGKVVSTIPCNYRTQKICVIFDRDHTEGVYTNKEICKIIDGKIVPYSNDVQSAQLSLNELFPSIFNS